MDRAPDERNFGHVTPNYFDVGEDVPRQAIEGVVAPADFQEFPHPVLQNMHRLESSDAGTYHAFSGSSIAGRSSTSAVYRPVSVTTAPPRSTPSSIAVQLSQLTSSSVPISMVSAGPSTSAVRFPVAVQGTRRVLTLPLRSPGKKPILTVGGNRLPPSVRQSGGEILIGKDKFYAVPITGQRMLKSGEGSVIQGIKRPAESVSGQGMPKVVIASNANMASFRQVIPVSRAAHPVQMSVAGPSTGYRVPTPVTIKTMSGQPVSAVTLESLMKAGISFPSARMGTPGAQRAPIVLNSTPGTSALEAVAFQPGAQNPSVVPVKNRVQHYIQIGGKFTRVEVIQDASKATVVQRPTAIQVQRTPAPAAAVAPRPAPAPPRLPAPVVEPALLDHNFAANASSRPASYAKKVAAAHKQALKYAESVPKWNLPDVNVGDFALDPADPLDAKILAEKNQNLPDEPQADVKPVEKTQSDPPPPLRTRKTCNCTKSMCLKLYCDCFASGEFCDGCNCLNCSNNMEHEGERQRAIAATLDRNPNAFRPKIGPMGGARERKRHNRGCNCKRSYCLKNYCECFEAKILCTHLCRCLGCRNQGDETSRQVLVQLCDAADQEAKARRKNHVASRFASKAEGEVNSAPPPVFEHALPPETFSFHTAPDLDGVWDYFRGEVIEATCMCLIGKGKEGVDQGLSEEKLEESIIAECKRCLDQIVRHAQGEQQLFQQMEQAAERAAERLKKNVIPDDDYDDDDEDEDGGEEEEAGAQPGPSFVVPRSSRAGASSSSVRKRLPV